MFEEHSCNERGGIGMNQRIKNSKDKVVGTVKETAGQILDYDELEFKGKLQTIKADLGNRFEDVSEVLEDKAEDLADNISDNVKKLGSKVGNVKGEVYSKANDFIDKAKSK